MTIIKDQESRWGYKLIGDSLFQAPIFSDGTLDEERWEMVSLNLTPYHYDIIEKLESINLTVSRMYKNIIVDE